MSDEEISLANPRLQQDPNTGHSFLLSDAPNNGRPSLEDRSTQMGTPKGIGGTVVPVPNSMGSSNAKSGGSLAQGQPRPAAVSPAQLMVLADQQEQDYLEGTRRAQNPYGSSLEGHLERPTDLPMHQSHVPEWLHEYMDKQPHTDPYHQVMPGRLDLTLSNKYLSERERLKMLKSLKEQGHF